MRHRLIMTGSAALVALVGLSACGGGSSGQSSAGSGGGTLVVDTVFNLTTADPGREFEMTGNLIDHALYSTLLTFDGSDVTKPVPDLAESYTASDDGTTYTFTLDPDAVFSDGTPVTSADVVFSLNRVKELKGNPSFLMDGITVTAPDDETVVLTSDTPNPSIPFILPNPALGILNSAVVKENGGTDAEGADTADKAEESLNTASAGSGPYTLSSFSTTSEVVLEANPNYWGDAPAYDKVVIQNTEANVQKLNVAKGEAQIALDLSPTQADGMSGVQVVNGASPNVFFLFTNEDSDISEVTSNEDFQEAVRYGLDYDSLLELAGEGSTQAAGVIPSMFLGSLSADQAVTRDVDRAKEALARSGLSNPTVDLAYPSDISQNGINFADLAARVQANLKEVGITVNLKGSSVQTALEDYRAGKEEMGLWFWGPDYPDPGDYLAFLPGQTVGLRANWETGDDPDLEALGEEAASTTDDDARATLYQQIQEEMNTSGPFMPLIQPAQIVVAGEDVAGVASNAVWLLDIAGLS